MALVKRITRYFTPLGSLACWNFDGTANELKDRAAHGFDLTWGAGSAEHVTLPNRMVGMLFNSNARWLQAPLSEELRIAKDRLGGGDASLTIEVILGPGQTTSRIFGSWASGESEATNYLYDLYRVAGSPDYWGSFNEYGNGSNINLYFNSCPEASPLAPDYFPDYWPRYVALTVSADGTSRNCYVNGVGDATLITHNHTTTAAMKETTGNAQRLYIGADNFIGTIIGIRLWNVEKSAVEVQALHDGLLTEFDDLFHEREEPAEFQPELRETNHTAAFEDDYDLPGGGGPEHHTFPQTGRGLFLPGPATQEADAPHGTKVEASFDDRYALPTAGGPTRHSATDDGQVGAGVRMPGPPGQAIEGFIGPNDVGVWEDVLRYFMQGVPEFNPASFDIDGRPHFTSEVYFHAFYYNTAGEPWNTPTANNFTGYARNGKHYTNGSEDAGPVWAPWATEGASDDRGSRADFPLHALIVTGRYEVVIFDLDTYVGAVNTLKVWMRFKWNDADYMCLGRGNANIRDLKMANGTMVAVSQYDSSPATNGGIFCVDFKANDQSWLALFRADADGTWRSIAGKTIVNRHETGLFEAQGSGVQIYSEYIYRVALKVSGTNGLFIAHAGEDYEDPLLYLEDNTFVWRGVLSGDDLGEVNLNDEWYKDVLIDEQGWLWTRRENRIYRHGPRPFTEQGIHQNTWDRELRPHVDIPHTILSWVAARDHLYIGTEVGVYKMERGTLKYWLAYTTPGGKGKGRLATGTDEGELLKASHSHSYRLFATSYSTASYLAVPQDYRRGGAVTVIRLYDDYVVGEYAYPDLTEDGAYFSVLTPA